MAGQIKCIVPVSGGKDSQVCVKLAVSEFGAKTVQGLFCDTKFEHPKTYAHVEKISQLYGVKINRVNNGSVEQQIRKHKRFPGGGARFCTEELKIWPAKRFYAAFAESNGPFEVWLGMRSGESVEREKRYAGKSNDTLYLPHDVIAKFPKKLGKLGVRFRLPIIDWTENDVFEYLEGQENPLYPAGFKRVGCFPCLAAGDAHKEMAFNYDETGQKHLALVRRLEPVVGRSVYSSKRGQLRNDSGQADLFGGCMLCSI